jgi:uncharacterized protein (TIGR03083 family)
MSTTTVATPVSRIEPISHRAAGAIAATENARLAGVVAALQPGDWSKPTDCALWDVRELVCHLVAAMEGNVSVREFVHQARAGSRAAGDRPFIDGMTEVQVRERSNLDPVELTRRLTVLAQPAARARNRPPRPLRSIPFRQEVAGRKETWKLGYLFDVVLTRDAWMHRVDLSRATATPLELTADHDGVIVADVVAEWARRHGRPFTLHLDGPAGATFVAGSGGEGLHLDAVEFCRIISGRATGHGLLTQEVPF